MWISCAHLSYNISYNIGEFWSASNGLELLKSYDILGCTFKFKIEVFDGVVWDRSGENPKNKIYLIR
jgi:hypothetical protein